MKRLPLIWLLFVALLITSCSQEGCTDPNSSNYDENAEEGGDCEYGSTNYSFWFQEEISNQLDLITPNGLLYFFVADTNVTLTPANDFSEYAHMANMDPKASSLEAPDCSMNFFSSDTLRNIRVEVSREPGSILNVIISNSLSLNSSSIIWTGSFSDLSEECFSHEITLD